MPEKPIENEIKIWEEPTDEEEEDKLKKINPTSKSKIKLKLDSVFSLFHDIRSSPPSRCMVMNGRKQLLPLPWSDDFIIPEDKEKKEPQKIIQPMFVFTKHNKFYHLITEFKNDFHFNAHLGSNSHEYYLLPPEDEDGKENEYEIWLFGSSQQPEELKFTKFLYDNFNDNPFTFGIPHAKSAGAIKLSMPNKHFIFAAQNLSSYRSFIHTSQGLSFWYWIGQPKEYLTIEYDGKSSMKFLNEAVTPNSRAGVKYKYPK